MNSNDPSLEDLKQLTVLYVEDEDAIREEVAYFLTRLVGRLITAENGKEGLEIFQTKHPDMVLSDIQMPFMNGLEMADEIKKRHCETPVIMTTAYNDTHFLQQAIAIGIDGFVLKPIKLEQLVQVMSRSVDKLMKSREVSTSRAQLAAYHHAAEEERQLVSALMARMMRPDNLKDAQLRHWLKPTELVGGDLVAVARSRNNKLYIMIADSTGHGLPAALNLLPINHIFYSMVSKNLSVPLMVEEMNWAVHEQSPINRYVSALVACIDSRNSLIEVWNGGMPGAYFIEEDGHIARHFESNNFPFGILGHTFVGETDFYQWSGRGQLVVYSDGIEDAENDAGKPFGYQRIIDVMQATPMAQRFDTLINAVTAHLENRNAFDDMTLVVVDNQSPRPA